MLTSRALSASTADSFPSPGAISRFGTRVPARHVMRGSMKAAQLVPACWLLFASFFLTRPLTAQSVYGQISGRLTTDTGTPVAGALVSVTAVQTGARAREKSDAAGYFAINNLAPDIYQIDIQ